MKTEESEGVMTLEIAQKEVGEWALRNFGEQGSYIPLMGMLEELGELCEARDRCDVGKMRDAIGDIGIYMLHYCAVRGWSMSELWDDRVGPTGPAMSAVRAICHSQIKGEQNIRGGTLKHDFLLKKELANLLWRMDQAAIDVGTDCLVLIYNTWELVKQRDWKKNPNNADKVAEREQEGTPPRVEGTPDGSWITQEDWDRAVVHQKATGQPAKLMMQRQQQEGCVDAPGMGAELHHLNAEAVAKALDDHHEKTGQHVSPTRMRQKMAMEAIVKAHASSLDEAVMLEIPGMESHRNKVPNG